MQYIINTSDMDREKAIMLFKDKIYEDDCNHQYIVAEILKEVDIDVEDLDACKALERENGMCPIDLFNGGKTKCLVVQSREYINYTSIDLLKELYYKHGGALIGVRKDIRHSTVNVYDSFEEFEDSIKQYQKL